MVILTILIVLNIVCWTFISSHVYVHGTYILDDEAVRKEQVEQGKSDATTG